MAESAAKTKRITRASRPLTSATCILVGTLSANGKQIFANFSSRRLGNSDR